jgi:hypothetical protein
MSWPNFARNEQIKQDVASIPASVNRAAQDVSDDVQAAAATTTPAEPAASASDKGVIAGQPERPAADDKPTPPEPEVEEISIEKRTIDPRPQVAQAKSSQAAEPGSGSTKETALSSESGSKLDASLSPQPVEPVVSQTADSEMVETNGKGASSGDSNDPKPGSAKSAPSVVSSEPEEVTNE